MEIELRDRAKDGGASRPAETSTNGKAGSKGWEKDEDRSKSPITPFECGEQGHTFRQCPKGKQGGGNGAKSKGRSGAVSRGQGAGASRASPELSANNP